MRRCVEVQQVPGFELDCFGYSEHHLRRRAEEYSSVMRDDAGVSLLQSGYHGFGKLCRPRRGIARHPDITDQILELSLAEPESRFARGEYAYGV